MSNMVVFQEGIEEVFQTAVRVALEGMDAKSRESKLCSLLYNAWVTKISHHLNQCRRIVNWTHGNLNKIHFLSINCTYVGGLQHVNHFSQASVFQGKHFNNYRLCWTFHI